MYKIAQLHSTVLEERITISQDNISVVQVLWYASVSKETWYTGKRDLQTYYDLTRQHICTIHCNISLHYTTTYLYNTLVEEHTHKITCVVKIWWHNMHCTDIQYMSLYHPLLEDHTHKITYLCNTVLEILLSFLVTIHYNISLQPTTRGTYT